MSLLKASLQDSYSRASRILSQILSDDAVIDNTVRSAQLLASQFLDGKKVMSCGNGGSMCDAMHFSEEFTGRFRKNRRALPALHLGDSSHVTCVANDFGYDEVFSRGVEAYGQEGDVFIGLSTSGNSRNIIRATAQAKKQKLKTILLLGKDGGKLKGEADIEFVVPEQTADRIQEVHMTILHIIIEGTERILFPENY